MEKQVDDKKRRCKVCGLLLSKNEKNPCDYCSDNWSSGAGPTPAPKNRLHAWTGE